RTGGRQTWVGIVAQALSADVDAGEGLSNRRCYVTSVTAKGLAFTPSRAAMRRPGAAFEQGEQKNERRPAGPPLVAGCLSVQRSACTTASPICAVPTLVVPSL